MCPHKKLSVDQKMAFDNLAISEFHYTVCDIGSDDIYVCLVNKAVSLIIFAF